MKVASTPAEWAEGRRLVREYAASLAVDLCFENFAHELEHFEQAYGPPHGRFYLLEGKGCAGLRRFDEGVGEMKRLYVVPSARGQGLGEALARSVIDAARALGYRRLVLDTLPEMKAARSLYRSLGFRDISAYRHNPVEGTLFYELAL